MVKNFFEKMVNNYILLKIINLCIETEILPDNLFQPMSSDLGLKVPIQFIRLKQVTQADQFR